MRTVARFFALSTAVIVISMSLTACSKGASDQPDGVVERFHYPVSDGGDPDQNWGDLHLPPGQHAAGSVPLVVFVHGGSWLNTSGAESADYLARDLAARGVAVFNIEYRRVNSGGGWPNTFTDVAAALDHVPEIARQFPELSIDDELVVGHSAGAQLAVWGSTRHNLEGHELGARPTFVPKKVISLSGPLDLVWAAEHGDDRIENVPGGTPEQVRDRFDSVDPIQNIDPQVPVIAVHGDADDVVPMDNSIRYIDALTEQRGSGRLELLPGEDHVSYMQPDSPTYPKILALTVETAHQTRSEAAARITQAP